MIARERERKKERERERERGREQESEKEKDQRKRYERVKSEFSTYKGRSLSHSFFSRVKDKYTVSFRDLDLR